MSANNTNLTCLTEHTWTKEASARDIYGMSVYPEHPMAVSWCLSGAMGKCFENKYSEYIVCKYKILEAVRALFPQFLSIPDFNDDQETTWRDVELVLNYAFGTPEEKELILRTHNETKIKFKNEN